MNPTRDNHSEGIIFYKRQREIVYFLFWTTLNCNLVKLDYNAIKMHNGMLAVTTHTGIPLPKLVRVVHLFLFNADG
jgi:hypothetical protein